MTDRIEVLTQRDITERTGHDQTRKPPPLTREEEMQAYTDALRAIVTAVAWQTDPIRLFADLQALANLADKAGHGPSAGLIDVLAETVKQRTLKPKKTH